MTTAVGSMEPRGASEPPSLSLRACEDFRASVKKFIDREMRPIVDRWERRWSSNVDRNEFFLRPRVWTIGFSVLERVWSAEVLLISDSTSVLKRSEDCITRNGRRPDSIFYLRRSSPPYILEAWPMRRWLESGGGFPSIVPRREDCVAAASY